MDSISFREKGNKKRRLVKKHLKHKVQAILAKSILKWILLKRKKGRISRG